MDSALRVMFFAVVASAASTALAQGELSVLCSVPLAWCEATAAAFERESGVRVKLAQRDASEALAQIAVRAFDLLRAMDRNIAHFPRTDNGAIRATARGETAIAVTFLHDGLAETAIGFPIRLVAPCEGTGYEVAAMSIVNGGHDPENAKRFYDWALTPAAQRIAADTKHLETPSNRATPPPPGAADIRDLRLIPRDSARFASPVERKRLIDKWEREVLASPQT